MKKFNLGLEAIGFQDSATFAALSQDFEVLKKSRFKDEATIKKIEKTIKDRFGLYVYILLDNRYSNCVWLPTFNQNHIFHDNWLKEYLYQDASEQKEFEKLDKLNAYTKENQVSIKNAKVTGIFSEMKTEINLNTYQLAGMGGEELASVFLHEVGHLFTYYENITKVTITNFVLAGLCSMAEQQSPVDEKKIYIKKLEDHAMFRRGALEELVQINDTKTTATVYLGKVIKENKSSTNSYFYDVVSCEQMADQFVSRLGGGRALVTALSIMDTRQGYPKTKSEQVLADIVVNSIRFVLHSVFMVFAPPLAVFLSGLDFLMLYLSGTGNNDFTYDDAKVRMSRIMNDLTQRLKEEKDTKKMATIIKEIETCELIVSGYEEYEIIYRRISNFLFKSNREAKAIYDLQRDLEDIAMNKLFMKSKKLSLIS